MSEAAEQRDPRDPLTSSPGMAEESRSKSLQTFVEPSVKERVECEAKRMPGRSVSQWLYGLILRELREVDAREASRVA